MVSDANFFSGVLIPFYDHDTRMVYIAGKVKEVVFVNVNSIKEKGKKKNVCTLLTVSTNRLCVTL